MQPNMIALGVLLMVAIGLVIYSLFPNREDSRDAVKRRLTGRRRANDEDEIRQQARASAREDLVKRATPMLSKLVMPVSDEEQSNLRLKLASAGFRQAQAQTIFMGSKTVCAVASLVAGLVVGATYQLELAMLLGLAAFSAGLGLMLPDLWLSLAISGRKQKVQHGLPDTLDLLVVSVESGLSLDAALKRVGDEMAPVHTELSEELRIATMESQMGLPRTEALENMARRSGVDELRSLVSVITQAEKFGTSIAKALRNQAEALRTKRRQAAEERAQKTAVKLMIPLVLFIFPAMFVVLAGPAALNVMRTMSNNPAFGGG
jgi:tight adherence protein C